MRCLNVANTAVDLTAQTVPFKVNYTTVVINPTGGAITLQGADDQAFTASVNLVSVPAGSAVEVELTKDFIRGSAAGPLILLGN